MSIKVLYFGPIKDLLDKDSQEIDDIESPTPDKVKEYISRQYEVPNLHELLASSANVINLEYCDGAYNLKPGDELAFIPPVSAG